MPIRRAIAITFLSSNFSMLVMFVVTLVAARFLKPEDIGVFSLAVVCINVVAVFRDLGTDAYILQAQTLDKRKVGSVLGLTVCMSWLLAVLLYAGREPLAQWFNAPSLADVLVVVICSFLLVPYASLMSCLLQRELRAGQLAGASLLGTLCFSATCLVLAINGAGAMALAWANFANIAGTLLICALLKAPHMTWLPRLHGWAEPARFGLAGALGNLARVTHQGLPDFALGRLQSAQAVGLYSRANGLVSLFQQVVGPTVAAISLPVLAREHHARSDLGPHLQRACAYLTVLAWPALAWVALFPAEIIAALYGSTWLPAASLVAPLCLAAAARVGYQLVQPSLVAIGRPGLGSWLLGAGLLVRACTLLLVQPQSLLSFVYALVLADLLLVPAQGWLARQLLGFGWRAAAMACWQSLRVTLGCLAAAWCLRWLAPPDAGPVLLSACSAFVVALSWLGGVLLWRHPFLQELQLLRDHLLQRWQRLSAG